MYIFTFNINQNDNGNTRVLTEFPTILTNETLSLIIEEIRNLVKNNFETLSKTNAIPIIDFKLGISSVYIGDNGFLTMHSFSVNLEKIRETKELIKKINN